METNIMSKFLSLGSLPNFCMYIWLYRYIEHVFRNIEYEENPNVVRYFEARIKIFTFFHIVYFTQKRIFVTQLKFSAPENDYEKN